MEEIIKLVNEGGWVAIGVFLGFFIQRLDRRMERLEGKIEAMREEYVLREEHYRDISGWKGEINRLDAKIDRLTEIILGGRK